MPKKYVFSSENMQEIETAIKGEKDAKIYKRLQALKLRAEGKGNAEIATITDFCKAYVSELVSKYFKNGILAISTDKRTGNNRKLTAEEETELLAPFIEQAECGHMLVVDEIRKAYEQKTGRKSAVSTIYYLLHRNGWRKVMPRSKHPKKASDEAIEAYKKNYHQN